MEDYSLFHIMQNSAISTIALHSFTLGFHQVAKAKKNSTIYPQIEYLFYVLPIVYNNKTMNVFKSSKELYSAISKNNTIVVGLQERANKMSKQTFDGLNMAFSKKILSYSSDEKTIILGEKFSKQKLPIVTSLRNIEGNSIKKISDSAFKLGNIFAKKNPQSIQFELNIIF